MSETQLSRMAQAVGLATTMAPKVIMNPDDPVAMMQEIVACVEGKDARIEELETAAWRVVDAAGDTEWDPEDAGEALENLEAVLRKANASDS